MAVVTRRQLTAALGGVVAALPLAARAQRAAMPVIGFLNSSSKAVFLNDRLLAFHRGLDEAGFVEGRNVAIEIRFADGQRDRLRGLADDLVRRNAAAIVVNGVSLSATMAATSTTPIVFVGGYDPVAQGLIDSLSRPSGNVTGISFNKPGLNAKRLELLNELLPKSTILAVLLDQNGPVFETQLRDVVVASRALGRQIVVVKATSDRELEIAFATIRQAGAGALFVGSSTFFVSQRRKLATFAASHALPASYEGREFVESGGLMSYGASVTDAYRRGGAYVGRILKGAKPSNLPVELPSKFEFVINLDVSKALGLNVPPYLLVQVTEVIE